MQIGKENSLVRVLSPPLHTWDCAWGRSTPQKLEHPTSLADRHFQPPLLDFEALHLDFKRFDLGSTMGGARDLTSKTCAIWLKNKMAIL